MTFTQKYGRKKPTWCKNQQSQDKRPFLIILRERLTSTTSEIRQCCKRQVLWVCTLDSLQDSSCLYRSMNLFAFLCQTCWKKLCCALGTYATLALFLKAPNSNWGLGQKIMNVAYFIIIIIQRECGGYTWNKDKRSIYVFYKLFNYLIVAYWNEESVY